MTESDVLREILTGRLTVCQETLRVTYLGRVKTPEVHRGRVRFKFGVRRTKVYRNRLVWMWFYREPPPPVVNHVNKDPSDDRPENLSPHSRAESDRQGNRIQTDKKFKAVADYFDFIAEFGVEPEYVYV